MKKQAGQLIALLVVLAVLAAGFAALRRYNEEQADKPAEEDTSISVNDLASEDVSRISYDYDGVTYSFVKEDDTWYSESDRELSITQNRITSMASYLAPLEAETVIENVTDYEQYGLDNPERTITCETADDSFTVLIGDYNSVAGGYYIMLENGDAVYLVQTKFLTVFNYSLEDLTETEEETEESSEAEETEAEETETEETETEETETTETETAQ
jgi:hypothetical protein